MGLKTWWSDRRLERMFDDAGALLERREPDDGARDQYADYADDPVRFIRDVIGDTPWAAQEEIAHAVRDHDRVTVRSCHKAGKDWLAARLALWWVYARGGLAVLTGPTSAQVEEILMRGEVRDAWLGGGFPGELHVRVLRPGGEGRAGLLARTSREASRLTGFHQARVLFIVTEAHDPDLAPAWKAAFANAAGDPHRILTLGNPVDESNARFRQAHRPGSGWHVVQITASDIPNVARGRTVVPGLLSRAGVEAWRQELGTDHPDYIARVLAEFPDGAGTDTAFPRAWLRAAVTRYEDGTLEGAARCGVWVAGLDPAGGGASDTVLAVRQGPVLRHLVTLDATAGGDHGGEALVDEVVRALADRAPAVATVVVDVNGPGAFLAPWLVERGVPVVEFSGASGAADGDKFLNLRAESYFQLR